MNNLFQYTKTEGQGWLVEKPEMSEPDENDYKVKFGSKEYYEDQQTPHHSPLRWDNIFYGNYKSKLKDYEKHLATLRRFKYDYPDPGKEMELGKDFEVGDSPEGWVREYYPNGDYTGVKHLEQVAIPITQRTYSEQDLLDTWEACELYMLDQLKHYSAKSNAPNKQQFFNILKALKSKKLETR